MLHAQTRTNPLKGGRVEKGLLDQQCLKKKKKYFQASTYGVADPGLKPSNYNSSLHTACLQLFIKLSLEQGRIPTPSKLCCGEEFHFALMSPSALCLSSYSNKMERNNLNQKQTQNKQKKG